MHYLPDGEYRQRLLAALRAAQLGVEELWFRYFALGGEVGRVEIEAYLNGLLPIPRLQHDLIAHAINERLDELAPPRAPYAAELPPALAESNGEHGSDDPDEDEAQIDDGGAGEANGPKETGGGSDPAR